jgi:hypothetical protein
MSLISLQQFTKVADRLASQCKALTADIDLSPSGSYYLSLSITGDKDVEIPMLKYANLADETASSVGTIALLKSVPSIMNIILALEEHLLFNNSLVAHTWDSYCENQDVRVSEYTNTVHYAKKNRYMRARNVFRESEVALGSCLVASAVVEFTAGQALGTGLQLELASGNNFAGSQLKAVLDSEITVPISIRIVGTSELGVGRTLDTGEIIVGPSGFSVSIPPASGRFVSVSAVTLLAGGSEGDAFRLMNLKEREISF